MNSPYEYSTIDQIKKGLAARGYTVEDLVLDGKYFSRFIAPTGESWLTSNGHISYPFITSTARRVSIEKNIAYDLASSVGVNIPRTLRVNPPNLSDNELSEFLQYAPLVVKPNDASLSDGLSRGVTTERALHKAIQYAANYSDSVLVQKQCEGQEIRFVVLNGRVNAAILRQTPQIVGDGISNIAELLERENIDRAQLRMEYLKYPQLNENILPLKDLDSTQLLAKGEVLELGKSTMIRGGASIYNITGSVHTSYFTVVEKLATVLGKGFVVVDMLVKDYLQKDNTDNYFFLEFNMAPVLKLFYSCRDGNQYDILKRLVPMIDEAVTNKRSSSE